MRSNNSQEIATVTENINEINDYDNNPNNNNKTYVNKNEIRMQMN